MVQLAQLVRAWVAWGKAGRFLLGLDGWVSVNDIRVALAKNRAVVWR